MVGIFDVTANGKSTRKARYFDSELADALLEVERALAPNLGL